MVSSVTALLAAGDKFLELVRSAKQATPSPGDKSESGGRGRCSPASEVNLDKAKFDEGGKTVTGQPNNHLRGVLNLNVGDVHTVRLTEAQLERLKTGK
jgi:hypothetical protein